MAMTMDTVAADLQLLQAVATSDTAFVLAVEQYNNQQKLYESIKDSTTLLNNNPDLATFTNTKEVEDMGRINRVEEKIRAGNYTDALAVNDSIEAYYTYEQKAKDLYEKMLAPYIRGEYIMDLTATELDSIKDIAYACPYTDGLAVYTARAVCRLFDKDWIDYSNPCETTTYGSNVRLTAPEEEKDAFTLFPNPASSVLTIETELEGTLIISNALGQVLGEYEIAELESFELDVSDFANGLYFCNFVGIIRKSFLLTL